MNFLKKIFQEADILLFYAYIWQIPFAWRLILVPNRGLQEGVFNEYMDISLYVGEVLLVLSYIFYKHKNKEKSINIKKIISLFHVEHPALLAIGIFLLFNISYSIDPLLSLVSVIHFLSVLFAIHIFSLYYVSRGTKIFYEIGYILAASISFQLLIAVTQLSTDQSVGLKWLSESSISIQQSGIAKSEIFGETFLRGYGTFPHPNVFSAYAIFIVIYFLFISKLFHVKQVYLNAIFLMASLSVIVAQSKLSIFLILGLIIFNIKNKFHVKLRRNILIASALIIISIGLVFIGDIQKSLHTRLDQINLQNQYQEISPFGTGIGTYRLSYDHVANIEEWWLFEPVHNILYISFYELGWLGMAIFIFQLGYWISKVPRGTFSVSIYLPAFVIFVLFTDHYGWDIYQGQQLLFFSTALFLNLAKILDNTIYKYHNINISQR
ncbi:MAG: hypothetical protein ACEQSB_03585 [Undibacterium sp.]